MLNKKQKLDSKECEKLEMEDKDKDCMGCSCNVCLAQVAKHNPLKELKQFISYAEKEGVISSDMSNKLIGFAKYYSTSIIS